MKKALKIISVVAVVAIVCVCLVACVPSTPDKAKAKLIDEKYKGVAVVDDAALLAISGLEGLTATVSGTKVEADDGVVRTCYVKVYYFDSSKNAKAAIDKVKKLEKADMIVKQSGKVIYTGNNQDAIDDIK